SAAGRDHAPLRSVWSARLPGGLNRASPVVAGDRVYIGTLYEEAPGQGRALCLDIATGREVWSRDVGDSVKSSLAISGDLVIGDTVTGRVFALERASGAPRWEYQLGDASQRWIYHAPLAAEDAVFCGSSNYFAALDARTGTPRWVR